MSDDKREPVDLDAGLAPGQERLYCPRCWYMGGPGEVHAPVCPDCGAHLRIWRNDAGAKREPVDWSGLTVGETVVIPRDLPWSDIGPQLPSVGYCRVTVPKCDKDTITYSTTITHRKVQP